MRQDPIVIEVYDPVWAQSFRSHKATIEALLGERLVAPLEHIGSTSVPGMPAKPIIDMLAVVEDYEAFTPAVPGLESIGWLHAPEPNDEGLRKWSLCFPSVEHRTHHLHVVEYASSGWRDWLLFRDFLSTHVEEAERYAALKRTLAATDDRDRARYRAAKAPLIGKLLDQARIWDRDGRA